jgi:hypothetical protein
VIGIPDRAHGRPHAHLEVKSSAQVDLQALHRTQERMAAARTRLICQMRAFSATAQVLRWRRPSPRATPTASPSSAQNDHGLPPRNGLSAQRGGVLAAPSNRCSRSGSKWSPTVSPGCRTVAAGVRMMIEPPSTATTWKRSGPASSETLTRAAIAPGASGATRLMCSGRMPSVAGPGAGRARAAASGARRPADLARHGRRLAPSQGGETLRKAGWGWQRAGSGLHCRGDVRVVALWPRRL